MKNHAFILPVHKQPMLLARILRILESPNHYFFIHVNKRVKEYEDFQRALADISNVTFVKRINVYHGGISQVYATLIMIDALMKHPVHFDYIHQISGQDYPLRSNEQFDEFFENTEDSFMCYNYEDDMDKWEPLYKQWQYGYNNNGKMDLFNRAIGRLGHTKIINVIFPRQEIPGFKGAWDWFSWSDKVVDYLLGKLYCPDYYHGIDLLKRFNRVHSPSEHIYPTILHEKLEELHIRKHYPLRYVSWHPHRPVNTDYRPFNLNELDYEFVINSPTFFCRKVDEVESAVLLDMIDKQRGNTFDITKYHDFF